MIIDIEGQCHLLTEVDGSAVLAIVFLFVPFDLTGSLLGI